jgi:hypothetical protein
MALACQSVLHGVGASLLAIHSKAFESLSLAGQAPTKEMAFESLSLAGQAPTQDEVGWHLRAKAFCMV